MVTSTKAVTSGGTVEAIESGGGGDIGADILPSDWSEALGELNANSAISISPSSVT